jgi:outer membrane lipoprotein carrier protein
MGFSKLLAALLVLAPGVGWADGMEPDRACAADVARKVQEHYETIADWSATFEQTRRAVVFGGGVAAPEPTRRGTVVFAKPGRMRWRYVEPDPSLFVTDGTVVWTWDPLLEEAQRLPDAGGVLSGAAVRFLMGEGDLLEAFRITTADCAARPVRLDLVPRKDEGYERLALDVDPGSGQVASSTVTDLFGNRTTVSFGDVRVNTSPDPAVFTFEPPEGATVLDLAVPDEAGAPPGR